MVFTPFVLQFVLFVLSFGLFYFFTSQIWICGQVQTSIWVVQTKLWAPLYLWYALGVALMQVSFELRDWFLDFQLETILTIWSVPFFTCYYISEKCFSHNETFLMILYIGYRDSVIGLTLYYKTLLHPTMQLLKNIGSGWRFLFLFIFSP